MVLKLKCDLSFVNTDSFVGLYVLPCLATFTAASATSSNISNEI